MNTGLPRLILLLTGICLYCIALAGAPLRHDPFARPVMPPPVSPKPPAAVEVEAPWSPVLSAVMVAGKQSLANIDGTIMAIGQEKDGYRLVEVGDREAVFTKGKLRIVLKIQSQALRQNKDRTTE